jgi:hypothetical protein
MNQTKKILLLIFLTDILVFTLVFSVSGFYNTGVDTSNYVAQIDHVKNPTAPPDPSIARRDFKPLYGLVGGTVLSFVDSKTAILILNCLFLIGLSLSFFYFLRGLEISEKASFVGTLWLITGYPLLKYGLALGTDISGWFFAVLSAAIGLYALSSKKTWLLLVVSVLGFVGFLTKETGVLGLGFVGLVLLFGFEWRYVGFFIKKILAISVPFLVLEGLYVYSIISRGGVTFLDWYHINAEGIHSYQTLPYFAAIESSTFNILILFSLVGLYFAIKSKDILRKKWLAVYIPLFLVSIPVIFWPIYISRIMYIQFLLVIPLSLYGLYFVLQSIKTAHIQKSFFYGAAALPIVTGVFLFLLAGKESLFEVLKSFI